MALFPVQLTDASGNNYTGATAYCNISQISKSTGTSSALLTGGTVGAVTGQVGMFAYNWTGSFDEGTFLYVAGYSASGAIPAPALPAPFGANVIQWNHSATTAMPLTTISEGTITLVNAVQTTTTLTNLPAITAGTVTLVSGNVTGGIGGTLNAATNAQVIAAGTQGASNAQVVAAVNGQTSGTITLTTDLTNLPPITAGTITLVTGGIGGTLNAATNAQVIAAGTQGATNTQVVAAVNGQTSGTMTLTTNLTNLPAITSGTITLCGSLTGYTAGGGDATSANQETILAAIAAIVPSTWTERTYQFTVNDTDGTAIQGVHMQVREGANSASLTTDASGQASIVLDDLTYSATLYKVGYNDTSVTHSFTVSISNTASTFVMTQIALSAPASPTDIRLYYQVQDEAGNGLNGVANKWQFSGDDVPVPVERRNGEFTSTTVDGIDGIWYVDVVNIPGCVLAVSRSVGLLRYTIQDGDSGSKAIA